MTANERHADLEERAVALVLVNDFPHLYRDQWAKAHECVEIGVSVDDALDNEWDNVRAGLGLSNWDQLEEQFRDEAWKQHEARQ